MVKDRVRTLQLIVGVPWGFALLGLLIIPLPFLYLWKMSKERSVATEFDDLFSMIDEKVEHIKNGMKNDPAWERNFSDYRQRATNSLEKLLDGRARSTKL